MFTDQIAELQDLLATPVEREWVEFKSWPDLDDKAVRAGIAKHLAALANHGGGYLIFGINDDGTRSRSDGDVRRRYNHDTIAGIIDRYLRPKFQCDVQYETCEDVEHVIVWIPSHKDTPIISKRDGPKDDKGRPQGLVSGAIYVRSPKPESVPVTDPAQWNRLIQRCVLSRRDELVGMMTALLRSGPASGGKPARKHHEETDRRLKEFHAATQRGYLGDLSARNIQRIPPPSDNFVQFSYMVHAQNAQIDAAQALSILEHVNAAVKDTVHYGWSMFYVFSRKEIEPHFVTDPDIDDGQSELIQASLIEDVQSEHLEFWRVALDGRVSLVRNFHEDRFGKHPPDLSEDAKWLDPWLQVRDLAELVRHARAFSEWFDSVERISFVIEWNGLKSRTTSTINQERFVRPYTAHADRRIVLASFSQVELIGHLPGVVSELYLPLHRLFDPRFNVSPEWVGALLPSFVM